MTSARERYAWLDAAACGPYPDWDSDGSWQTLLAICAGCPVRDPCLAAAVELGTGGVRGGTTPAQRHTRYGSGDLTPWVGMVDGRPDPGDRYALAAAKRKILEHGTDLLLPQALGATR